MTASLQKSAEPSMEEILASIRRIIADDQTRAKPGPANTAPATASWAAQPNEAGARGATIETFPSSGRGLLPRGDDAEDDEDIAALDAAIATPEDDAGTSVPSSARGSTEPSAANDARYFPPEAEFQPSPPEDRNIKEHASATVRKDEAGASMLREPLSSPERDFLPQRELSAARPSGQVPSSSERGQQGSMLAVGPRSPTYRATPEAGTEETSSAMNAGHVAPRDEEAPTMLSNEADAAIGRAFDTLRHTVLADNARTLDGLVQEMLRPMLKNWLDDNLPPLVERLVRAEIERVARGRPS